MNQVSIQRFLKVALLLCVFALNMSLLAVWIVNSHKNAQNVNVSSPKEFSANHLNETESSKQVRHLVAEVLYQRRKLKTQNVLDQVDQYKETTIVPNEFDLPSIPMPDTLTNLEDIFISVKTTRIFHRSRLDIILDTWFKFAKNQTYFFSDSDEEEYKVKSGGHLINTNCSVSHNRKALCCKMSVEFDYFIASNKKWWCHFDDDNYVNVPQLVKVLQRYNPLSDWYLGKSSIKQPLEINERDSKKKVKFSFGTGGAGFCVSKALALKMIPVASDGKLISIGDKIRLPDDVTIGYIIGHLLSKKLTEVEEFHSHLESMSLLKKESLRKQISFSYSETDHHKNVLSVNQTGLKRPDHTKFYSLHCYLYPQLCKF